MKTKIKSKTKNRRKYLGRGEQGNDQELWEEVHIKNNCNGDEEVFDSVYAY